MTRAAWLYVFLIVAVLVWGAKLEWVLRQI